MSGKRGFLQLFTLGFFALVLLGIISFFLFIAYNFITLPDKLDGDPPSTEQNPPR